MPDSGPPQLSMISQLSQAFPPLILISNPKSGDGKGPSFVQTHVLRTLKEKGVPVNEFVVTNGPGNAGEEEGKEAEVGGCAHEQAEKEGEGRGEEPKEVGEEEDRGEGPSGVRVASITTSNTAPTVEPQGEDAE